MLPSHGTVFFLFVHLLLFCQGDRPAGERLRGVVRRGTERCASPVGCGEKAREESIAESSRGRLWEEGVVPFVFEANLRECKVPLQWIVMHSLGDAVPKYSCCMQASQAYIQVTCTNFTTVCVSLAIAGDEVRASFSKAMAMWERETCIRFVPRTAEEDYVELGEGR